MNNQQQTGSTNVISSLEETRQARRLVSFSKMSVCLLTQRHGADFAYSYSYHTLVPILAPWRPFSLEVE